MVAVTLVVLTRSAMSVVNQAILLVSAGSVEVQENAGVAVPLDIGGAQAMVKGLTAPVVILLGAAVCHLVTATPADPHTVEEMKFLILMEKASGIATIAGAQEREDNYGMQS